MMMYMNVLVWGLSTTFVGLSFNNILREMSVWLYRDKDVIYFGPLYNHHRRDENLVLYFFESKN